MTHRVTLIELVITITLCASAIVAAAVVWLGFRWLHRRAQRTAWSGGDATIRLVHATLPLVVAAGGVWLAEQQLPLSGTTRGALERMLLAALILAFTVAGAGLAVDATRGFLFKRAGVAPSTTIFANVVRLSVLVIGILVALETLGISVTPLIGALGVGGLAVALALQDTLSNLFAGIQLLASKKIRPGHYITLSTSGQEGHVVDVNWRNTVIRELPNNMIIVPNAMLASQAVINYNQPSKDMSVVLRIGVAYGSDLEQVEKVTAEVAADVMRTTGGGVPEHAPLIRYHTFGARSVDFSVILRAKEYTDQYLLTHEFMKCLHRRYQHEGIEIPVPA